MEKISWIDPVRKEEVLQRVTEHRIILHTVIRGESEWTCSILRRNCPLKHVIEGKMEGRIKVTGRRGGKRKQLLDDFKETRRHCKLKQGALDRTVWRSRY